tara:strand:- start:90 stop:452 length:363 start_codon:yes stop_codon:yes gene_type:complete
LKISQSDNFRLIKVLNNSNLIAEYRGNWIAVRVYKTDNGSDSAGLTVGHEVSHNLLIAVSEFDENPNQNVFEIGPFLNPKFITWSELNEYEKEFEVEYGVFDQRKKLKLAFNINKLKINE